MDKDLYDLVLRAQANDRNAANEIISIFTPAIKAACYKMKHDHRDDLEQVIIELILKKTMTFDITRTPDFSTFCNYLNEKEN